MSSIDLPGGDSNETKECRGEPGIHVLGGQVDQASPAKSGQQMGPRETGRGVFSLGRGAAPPLCATARYSQGVPEVHLEPMADDEYAAFRRRSEASYAKQISASRAIPPTEAVRKAAEEHQALLSDGLRTPGHYLWTAFEGDQPVGHLWLHVEAKSDGLHAFGYDFEVRPELRRRGYGRAITRAAEQKCRDMDVVAIDLTVFGPNKAAQSLYEDLGFEPTVLQMRKHL